MFNSKEQRIACRCSYKVLVGSVTSRFKQNWNEQWKFSKEQKYKISWKCVLHISSCYIKTLYREEKKEPYITYVAVLTELRQTVAQCTYICADCYSRTDTVPVMFSVLPHSTFAVQIQYKLYSLQLNCTYTNYTEAVAACSATQQHITFNVQILYKLYCLQLNCTYSRIISSTNLFVTLLSSTCFEH